MPGNLQPLVSNQRIVNQDGTPTDYFIRWAQAKQIDLQGAITATEALAIVVQFMTDNPLIEGSGISLSPSGDINDGVTIAAEVQPILDQISTTWGDVLFRGDSDWQALAAGTAGQFLKTNGAGADPSWGTPSGGGGSGAIINYRATAPLVQGTDTYIPGMEISFTLLTAQVVKLEVALIFARASGYDRYLVKDQSGNIVWPSNQGEVDPAKRYWYSTYQLEGIGYHVDFMALIDLAPGNWTLKLWRSDAFTVVNSTYYERGMSLTYDPT